MKLNKRGTDKILSVYWFAILTIVAVGIVIMVATFYGHPYDVRNVEANIMANKIAGCLSPRQGINKEVLDGDFLKNCNFDFGDDKDQYYFEIGYFDIAEGNVNLKDVCDREDKSVVCVEKRFYPAYEEEPLAVIKILTAVRKAEQNVK